MKYIIDIIDRHGLFQLVIKELYTLVQKIQSFDFERTEECHSRNATYNFINVLVMQHCKYYMHSVKYSRAIYSYLSKLNIINNACVDNQFTI
jgi:hypothetical protein